MITQYQDVAYDRLAEGARAAGLDLNWSSRILYSRLALTAAETVRINQPGSHPAFSAAIFRAYFALGTDIGDWSVIAGCADEVLHRAQPHHDQPQQARRIVNRSNT